MRVPVTAFLIAQLADLATTGAGLALGIAEANPLVVTWPRMLMVKLVAMIGVALILQIKRPCKLDAIVPVVAGLPVVWNILVIGLSV